MDEQVRELGQALIWGHEVGVESIHHLPTVTSANQNEQQKQPLSAAERLQKQQRVFSRIPPQRWLRLHQMTQNPSYAYH